MTTSPLNLLADLYSGLSLVVGVTAVALLIAVGAALAALAVCVGGVLDLIGVIVEPFGY